MGKFAKSVLLCSMFSAVFLTRAHAQLPEVFTLSLVPVGGTTVQAGAIVQVEVLLTVTADSCPHTPCTVGADCVDAGFPPGTTCVDGDPGAGITRTCGGDPVNGIRFEGNQVDVPCMLPGGTSGSINIVPGLEGGSTDVDMDGLRGPSDGGVAFLFGAGGLGPFAPATCIIATTPAPGANPVNVASGLTRYIGTFFYEVSECAAGSFEIFFECTDQGGPLTPCEDDPEIANTTRFRNDCPVSTAPGPLIRFNEVGTTLVVPVGRCCLAGTCIGELNQLCCQNQGGTWSAGGNCDAGCPCTTPADCDDDNACTTDNCAGGFCENTNNTSLCNDGLDCTINDACLNGMCQGTTVGACPGQICVEGLGCVQCDPGAGVNCAATPERCCPTDNDVCTDDVCDPNGTCSYPIGEGNACSDGLFCTRNDQCNAQGVCGGAPRTCPPATPVCCEEAAGGDGACVECCDSDDCDDDVFCNGTEACVNFLCQASTGNPCVAPLDICLEATDMCVGCMNPVDCNDDNPCTSDNCVSGQCTNVPEALGTACGNPEVGPCDNRDVCDGQGNCSMNLKPDATPCDDQLFCNGDDACLGGVCQHEGSPCSGATPFCDENTNMCVAGTPCTSVGDCQDDGNVCTTTQCIDNRCVNTPNTLGCSDGNACTTNDACAAERAWAVRR